MLVTVILTLPVSDLCSHKSENLHLSFKKEEVWKNKLVESEKRVSGVHALINKEGAAVASAPPCDCQQAPDTGYILKCTPA